MLRTSLLLTLACLLAPAAAQTIDVSPPGPVLAGDTPDIIVTGLPPGAQVSIEASRYLQQGPGMIQYRAAALFRTSAEGRVDLRNAVPVSGSYRKADIRGLFWSMQPVRAAGPVPATARRNAVHLKALVAGKEAASADIEFMGVLPGVTLHTPATFPGAVFARPQGSEKLPVVIVLGGSEGGSHSVREVALNLASRGFAALALPYYSPAPYGSTERELPALPASFVDIPVERLQEAHAWLKQRADVDGKRVALMGTSKGAEFALVAASKMPWITSVVAIVPTDVVWQGWGPAVVPADAQRSSFSYKGKPLPFVPNKDFLQELSGFQTGTEVRYRRPHDKGRAANAAAAVKARIEIERFAGPVLVAGAMDDQMWASGMMAQNIAERRAAAGRETVTLVFPDAGHALNGSGWNPTTQYNASMFKVGGTPEANAAAQAETWDATLAFLRRTLGMYAQVAQR